MSVYIYMWEYVINLEQLWISHMVNINRTSNCLDERWSPRTAPHPGSAKELHALAGLVSMQKKHSPNEGLAYPIGSMYAIYGNIYHQYTPNVSIYTIHGSYGDETLYFIGIMPLTHAHLDSFGDMTWKLSVDPIDPRSHPAGVPISFLPYHLSSFLFELHATWNAKLAKVSDEHDREQSLLILRFTACGWSNLRNENNNLLSDGWGYSIPQVGPELCALHGHVRDGCFFFQSSISTHGCQWM